MSENSRHIYAGFAGMASLRGMEYMFTLDDFIQQMERNRKMGFGDVLRSIPGLSKTLNELNLAESDFLEHTRQIRAIYDSMTILERRTPEMIDADRRRRISCGAGVSIMDVAQFFCQFRNVARLMGENC